MKETVFFAIIILLSFGLAAQTTKKKPSSTTLLVLSVMPTLAEQLNRRLKYAALKRGVSAFCICFSAFMVIGRLIAGVHWFTDIVGAVLLSAGVYCIYKAAVLLCAKQDEG